MKHKNTSAKTIKSIRETDQFDRFGSCGFVFSLEMQGEPMLDMFITAISLAVAAVPETLTVIVTLTLAYGVQKWRKRMRLFADYQLWRL